MCLLLLLFFMFLYYDCLNYEYLFQYNHSFGINCIHILFLKIQKCTCFLNFYSYFCIFLLGIKDAALHYYKKALDAPLRIIGENQVSKCVFLIVQLFSVCSCLTLLKMFLCFPSSSQYSFPCPEQIFVQPNISFSS